MTFYCMGKSPMIRDRDSTFPIGFPILRVWDTAVNVRQQKDETEEAKEGPQTGEVFFSNYKRNLYWNSFAFPY